MAQLAPAGRCHNYTFWTQKASFSIHWHLKLVQTSFYFLFHFIIIIIINILQTT